MKIRFSARLMGVRFMLGRAKRQVESTSRFCRSPLELPYGQLYTASVFTVAVSKLEVVRGWSFEGPSTLDDPTAYGLLHGSNTYPDHRAEEPLLPVQVRFERNPLKPAEFGSAHFDRSTETGTYILYVNINDADGRIAAAFDNAMSRAVLSGYDFVHLRCAKRFDPERARTDFRARAKEQSDFLRRVEAGEAELESLTFERVFFDDNLIAKAPAWSWAWRDWEFGDSRFQSAEAQRWRREWLPHRKG